MYSNKLKKYPLAIAVLALLTASVSEALGAGGETVTVGPGRATTGQTSDGKCDTKVILASCLKERLELAYKLNLKAPTDNEDLVPLHRFYIQTGDHFYSTDRNGAIAGTYTYEGIAGLVYKVPKTGTKALHRYYNAGIEDHFYTTNWSELGGGSSNNKTGWVYEGVECYICGEPTDGTLPWFRYWSGRDHFYTPNWNELKGGKAPYKMEMIAGYIFPPQ